MLEPVLLQQLAHGVGQKLLARCDGERVAPPLLGHRQRVTPCGPLSKGREVAQVDGAMVQAVVILSDNDGEDKEDQPKGRCSDR